MEGFAIDGNSGETLFSTLLALSLPECSTEIMNGEVTISGRPSLQNDSNFCGCDIVRFASNCVFQIASDRVSCVVVSFCTVFGNDND